MPTIMPYDDNNNVIPALALRTGGSHAIAASTSTSARNAASLNVATRIISLYATGNVYIAFGGSSVTATASDHFFPAGTYYDFAIGGGRSAQHNYVAALAADSACTVYISEKE